LDTFPKNHGCAPEIHSGIGLAKSDTDVPQPYCQVQISMALL